MCLAVVSKFCDPKMSDHAVLIWVSKLPYISSIFNFFRNVYTNLILLPKLKECMLSFFSTAHFNDQNGLFGYKSVSTLN